MAVRIANIFSTTSADFILPVESARQLRRADDFIRLSVTAAHTVLSACIDAGSFSGTNTGLYLGTAFGPMQTNFDVLDQVVGDEPVSPTLFSHSVFNGAAGYIAAVLGIHGRSVTLTDFSFPFFRALQQGMTAVENKTLDRCLVMQVETYSDLLIDGVSRYCGQAELWAAGVACWLLEQGNPSKEGEFQLDSLDIWSDNAEGQDKLCLQETVFLGESSEDTTGYLGGAVRLTERLHEEIGSAQRCKIQSLYGTVLLNIRPFEEI